MAAKIQTNAIGELLAKSFYTLIKENIDENSLYAGVSYIPDADWVSYSGSLDSDSAFLGGSDLTAPDVDDAEFYNQSLLSLHKIYAGGISRVVKRIDWNYGYTYDSYPVTDNSYVLVKEYVSGYVKLNVYRCLFSPNTPSYVSPSGTSQSEFKLSDGYVWKYMYSIGNSAALRFLNNDWMPVPEKIPTSDYSSISIDSANYEQYVVQTNAETGAVYGLNLDSDVLTTYINSDTTFAAAFGWNSVDLVARSSTGNDPSQTMKVTLGWDSTLNKFTTSLVESGKGYSGQVTFGLDSDLTTKVLGLTAAIAPGEGFGADAPTELGAKNIMITARVVPDENNTIFYNNSQYNLLALHNSPIDTTTGKIAQSEFYVGCLSFIPDIDPGFIVGDIIAPSSDSTRTFHVVGVYGGQVYYICSEAGRSSDSLSSGIEVRTTDSTKIANIVSTSERDISLNSSAPLVVEKLVEPVTRIDGQIESFNFIITF